MISSDRNILVPGSAVGERMKEYGGLAEELHIVLLSDRAHGLEDAQLGKNVWVYPTNSSIKYFRPWDAARLGKKVVFDRKFVRGLSVVTTQDPFECGLAGLKIKSKWRLPLEVQLHTDPFSPYFTGFFNYLRKRIAKKVLKKADSVRCVSSAVAEEVVVRTGREKVFVLPIYVDAEKLVSAPITFDLHARYGWRFVLLSVARLESEKNLGLALQILARVRERFADTGLVIVGTGSEEKSLRSLAKHLKLDGFVEFAGWQSDLASFYRTANVFLQTSHFEGYGLALVEAGLSGLPVVSTPVGIAQELHNGQDAYICREGDVAGFATAITDLIENNFKRENLQINLKRTLESKLISKDDYLSRMKSAWESTSRKIHS